MAPKLCSDGEKSSFLEDFDDFPDFFDDDFEGLNFGSNDFFNIIFEKDDKRENDVESYEEMDYNNYDNPFGNQLFNSLYENPFCTKEKKGNLDELLKK